MNLQLKFITKFFCAISFLLYLHLAYTSSLDGLFFKIICEKDCQKNSIKPKNITLFLAKPQIKCIEKNYESTESTNPDDLSLMKMFFEKSKRNNSKTVPAINILLTDEVGNKFYNFTKANIGSHLRISYKNKEISTAMLVAPLTSKFTIVGIDKGIFSNLKKFLQECPTSHS